VTVTRHGALFDAQKWYILAYDIPVTPEARRRRFYRTIQRWLRKHPETHTLWMTQSTVITQSYEFTRFILNELDSYNDDRVKACLLEGSLQAIINSP